MIEAPNTILSESQRTPCNPAALALVLVQQLMSPIGLHLCTYVQWKQATYIQYHVRTVPTSLLSRLQLFFFQSRHTLRLHCTLLEPIAISSSLVPVYYLLLADSSSNLKSTTR